MIEDYDIYELNSKEKSIVIAVLILLLTVLGWTFYDNILLVILTPFFLKKAIRFRSVSLANKRKNLFITEFRDLLFILSSHITTGKGMSKSLINSIEAMHDIHGPDSLIITELKHIEVELMNQSIKDVDILEGLAKRVKCHDVWEFVTTYKVCKTSGGNMVIAMNKVAEIIGEKINMKREIDVFLSQKKLEGYIILLMPILIIGGLKITTSDYFQIMYETVSGIIIMSFVTIILVVAYRMIERITHIEI